MVELGVAVPKAIIDFRSVPVEKGGIGGVASDGEGQFPGRAEPSEQQVRNRRAALHPGVKSHHYRIVLIAPAFDHQGGPGDDHHDQRLAGLRSGADQGDLIVGQVQRNAVAADRRGRQAGAG